MPRNRKTSSEGGGCSPPRALAVSLSTLSLALARACDVIEDLGILLRVLWLSLLSFTRALSLLLLLVLLLITIAFTFLKK